VLLNTAIGWFLPCIATVGNCAIFWQSIMAFNFMGLVSELFYVRNLVAVKGLIRWSWHFLPFNWNMLCLLSKSEKRTKKWKRIEGLTDLWTDVPRGKVYHREQIPELIVRRVLEMMTEEGDWVLDMFAGGGNVIAVCREMKRNVVGVEIDDKAIHILSRRLGFGVEIVTDLDKCNDFLRKNI